jgi:EAL domain-containing protein (putative c-di-GMP-specific phosphodiesterase class I)
MLENQFALALQPIIDLDTRLLIGFEALLRWHHPEKGMIPPGEFIPVIENTPFMLQLDYWVIARACRLLLDFKENGLEDIKLCVNLSASQFTDPSLPEYLSDQLLKYDVEPGNLQLELTETALVADMATTIKIIEKIRSLGCKIAIDDFGTGYASLSYLKNIPADVVKLDQSFIGGMMDNQSDRNIVFATVSMVSSIGQIVVAEGIEMSSQYELLCHFGCQQGQGYLISRPINEDKLWEELQEKLSQGRWHVDIPIFGENENQMPLL